MQTQLKGAGNGNGNGNGNSNSNGYQGKLIAETIGNGFFKVDRRWTVKYWNKASEKLLGIKSRDIVGKNLWETFSAIIPPSFFQRYHSAFLQDIPDHFEEYWDEKGLWFDVLTYHFEDTLSVSFKTSHLPAHSAHPDHPEQQLKALNELYRLVTEITNDCLWEWDLQSREIFWIDGGHKRAFGYAIENALIPQSFWEGHVHPDDRGRILAGLDKVIGEGEGNLWEDEYRFAKADGDYVYVHDRGHIIYDGEKAVRMIGATQDITERLAAQKEIISAVLTAQENERTNIGRELHDNLNQILGAAKLYIELAKTDEENRAFCLDKSAGYIVDVIEEIRRISKRLSSPGMRVMGLVESIEIMLDDLVMVHPIKISLDAEGFEEEELGEKLQLDIFRIVQEQLNNILRHADATQATIVLAREGNELHLSISDNGVGCDLEKEKMGVGIINIRSRVDYHHGRVTIVSKPGEGYTLEVGLSLSREDSPQLIGN